MVHDGHIGEGQCESQRPMFSAYAGGTLDVESELTVRTHLAGCSGCRAFYSETVDPSILFMELVGRRLPAGFWTGFMEGLRERLAVRSAFDWGALLRYPRLAYLTAPLASVLVLGAALVVTRPVWRAPAGGINRTEAVRSPYDPPLTLRGRDRPDSSRPGHMRPPAPPVGTSTAVDLPTLELVALPGARVYRFTLEGSGDETPIYLVFDESIEF